MPTAGRPYRCRGLHPTPLHEEDRPHDDRSAPADPALGLAALLGADRPPYRSDLTSRTVAFWEAQAKGDPQGFLERREVAGAYLARLRESGDIADAVKAEEAARKSLKISGRRMPPR